MNGVFLSAQPPACWVTVENHLTLPPYLALSLSVLSIQLQGIINIFLSANYGEKNIQIVSNEGHGGFSLWGKLWDTYIVVCKCQKWILPLAGDGVDVEAALGRDGRSLLSRRKTPKEFACCGFSPVHLCNFKVAEDI